MLCQEYRRPSWWAGELACNGPDGDAPARPWLRFEQGLTAVLAPRDGSVSDEQIDRAVSLVRQGLESEDMESALERTLGNNAGLIHLMDSGQSWLIFWPCHHRPLWLFSPQRMPPCWDLAAAATESAGACVRVPAGGGDVIMLLPDGSTEEVEGAARPGNPGASPADLSEAAADGGPALLEAIEARWQGRNEPAFALVVEAR